MAAKKPAKKNISNTPEKVKELPGKAVKYFGAKNSEPFCCPTCARKLSKGIIYEDNKVLFCSRICIPKQIVES